MSPKNKIEAILFYKGEPVAYDFLSKIIGTSVEEVKAATQELRNDFENRGISLVTTDTEVQITTSDEVSSLIQKIDKEEIDSDLSKASLETLSVILYQGPVNKRDIDYIRGVNSGFILRSLSVRGLVDKEVDPKDKRTHLYKPSTDLLMHLGIDKAEQLPKYNEVREKIKNFKNQGEDLQEEPKEDNL